MSAEDRAQEQEAYFWELNNVHRKKSPTTVKPGDPGYGPEECEECGAEMHPVRRSYGFRLCIDCAMREEARASGRIA